MSTSGGTLTRTASTPARDALYARLAPLCPSAWAWVLDEGAVPETQKTRVRISQRSIDPGTTGSIAVHWITFQLVVTVPSDAGLRIAEQQLDDQMDAFLWALDSDDVPWGTAEKAVFEDGGKRLGYQLPIKLFTDTLKE